MNNSRRLLRRGLLDLMAWALAAGFSAWALIRLLGLDGGYPLVPLIAFTPYVAVGAVLAAAGLAALRQWAPAIAVALAAAILVGLVLPRAIADRDEGGIPLRVMTANMKLGTGDAGPLVELVREQRVDVLAVQEVTRPLVRQLNAAGLTAELPHRVISPAPGSAGGGVWSRRAVLEVTEVPGSLAGPQPAVGLQVPGEDRNAIVYPIHPPPPTGPAATEEWAADLATIPPVTEGGPTRILAGDFNATLDHAEMRDVLDRGYRDAADVAGIGLKPTWPNGRLFPPQVTIDHVLVDARAGIADAQVYDLPGSDHRAVLAEVLLPAAGAP